jgi:hypothetical protein
MNDSRYSVSYKKGKQHMPNKPSRGPNGRFLPKQPVPVVTPMIISKPFSKPTPLQDQLARRFGPKTPVLATKQVPGRER